MNQVETLKAKIFSKKKSVKNPTLTSLLDLARHFSCLDALTGADYEVKNQVGVVVYTIRRKPLTLKQVNDFLKTMQTLKELDADAEKAKWGKPSKRGRSK